MDEKSGPANSFGDLVKLFARKQLLFLIERRERVEECGVNRPRPRQGKLNRPARGIHTLADAHVTVTEHHSYAEVAKRVPKAAICLLSDLAFHETTTQSPASVWIALPKRGRNACRRFAFT
jgi:predicted transcriptional regulator of viral defense system